MSDNPEEQEEEKRPEAIVQAYRERLTVLKKAQEYSQKNDIPKAVEYYSTYLNTLAAFFKTSEDKLNSNMFDKDKDLTELLLISHAYWELATAYDRSPTLHNESIRCLDQFVKFSTGFKFQHINAQMLRKFVKKRKAHNPKAFNQAYERLHVASKGCYIASHCFGENDHNTNFLRLIKKDILSLPGGFKFVELYYRYSPRLVNFCSKHSLSNYIITNTFFKPFLLSLIKVLKVFKK
jgi:hypothetical protein